MNMGAKPIEGTTAVVNTARSRRRAEFVDGQWLWSDIASHMPSDIALWLTDCVCGDAKRSFMGLQFISHSVPLNNIKSTSLDEMLKKRGEDVARGRIQPSNKNMKDVPPFMRKPNPDTAEGKAQIRFNRRKDLENNWVKQMPAKNDVKDLLQTFLNCVTEGVLICPDVQSERILAALSEQTNKVLGEGRKGG